VLVGFGEYMKALESFFRLFAEEERAQKASVARKSDFKGFGCWMTTDYTKTVYPNS
jgi:hypothetical protein